MDLSSFYFNTDPLDEVLNEKEISLLYKGSSKKQIPRGIKIFEERTYPKGVYFLKKGKVKIYQSSSAGSEQIIAIHGAGELFGYRPILCDELFPVTAKTLEASTIIFIPKKNFLKALSETTGLSNILLKYLSHEFTVWVNTISILARTTVKERLLLNILLLAEKYREKSRWPIRISLPKADLACLIGTSNETLARILKILKGEKLIISRGRSIEISGPEQFKKIQKLVSLFL
jgi:CRP-like cAMP-binding protein